MDRCRAAVLMLCLPHQHSQVVAVELETPRVARAIVWEHSAVEEARWCHHLQRLPERETAAAIVSHPWAEAVGTLRDLLPRAVVLAAMAAAEETAVPVEGRALVRAAVTQ